MTHLLAGLVGAIAMLAAEHGLRLYTRHCRDQLPWGDRIDDAFCGSDDVSDQRDYGARRRP